MKVRIALGGIALLLVLVGIALWVDAGTRHMESLPQTQTVELAAGPPDDGPDRLPARLAWAGATICLIGAVTYRQRD